MDKVCDGELLRQKIIAHRYETWDSILCDMTQKVRIPSDKSTRVCFPNASSYLFATGETLWAMDPVYTLDALPEEETLQIAERLRSFRFFIITHLHYDHFSLALASLLGCEKTQWILPERCKDYFLKLTGFPEHRIQFLKDEESCIREGIRITAHTGYHADAALGLNVPSASFTVELPDGKRLFFPVDVRSFDTPPPRGEPDYLFGHVWLGRVDTRGDEFPDLDHLVHFLLNTAPRNLFLTHLLEVSRSPNAIWLPRHAELLRDRILHIAPELNVIIPKHGQTFYL